MGGFGSLGGAAAALAALSLAVPAEAQHHRPRHHHRNSDRIDAGDVLIGGILVGGIVALVNGEKKRREREAAYYADYDAELSPDGVPVPVEGSSPVPDLPAPYASEYDGLYDMDAAADRCAVEAETLGQDYARLSRIASITDQVWNGKSWVIKGRVELADSYSDPLKRSHKFRCALRAGREPVVSIEGLTGAY